MKLTFEERRIVFVSLIIITISIILYQVFNNFDDFWIRANQIYQSAFAPLTTAFFIAYIMNLPMTFIERQLEKRTKLKAGWRRTISIPLTIFFFLLIFFILIRFAFPQLTESVNSLTKNIDGYIATVRNWLNETFVNYDIQLPQIIVDKITEIMNSLVSFVTTGIGMMVEGLYGWITGTVSSIMGFIVSFAISLYMLAEKESIALALKRMLYSVTSEAVAKRILWLCTILDQSFSNFFRGQLTEGVILSVLAMITMSIFRFPYAVLIGAIVGLTNIIPMFGAFLGGIIGFVIIFMTNPVQALWFALFVIVLQQIESNIIYPRVVGSAIGLSGFWIFVAVTVGGGLGGLFGIILGIPIFTTLQIILKEFVGKRLKEKKIKMS